MANLSGMLIGLNLDLAIVADYGLIIPKEIFEIPKYKTLNIHFSKLPKYRGPSPVQYTILNGDRSAWISYILISEKMDTGDILLQEEFPLTGKETTGDLYQKLFVIASQKLPEVINNYVSDKITPKKQDDKMATYTKLLTRDDGFIPFPILKEAINGKTPIQIERALRAFSPWPGLYTNVTIKQFNNLPAGKAGETISKRLKILKLHLDQTTKDQRPTTRIIIDLVQLEGKKPVSWKQFLEGYPVLH